MPYALLTSKCSYNELTVETRALYDALAAQFDRVMLIDPRLVFYEFVRGSNETDVMYRDQYIDDAAALVIRSTNERETSTSILAHTLRGHGAMLSDPLSRFGTPRASKLLTTLRWYRQGCGPTTFIGFDYETVMNRLSSAWDRGFCPMFGKPINGSHRRDLASLDTWDDMRRYVSTFFTTAQPDTPILIQQKIDIYREWRVMLYDGMVLGMVRKTPRRRAFLNEWDDGIAAFTKANVSNEGLLGVDVAQDRNGEYYIIESNRAPEWERFEQVTGVNVARYIAMKLREDTERTLP